MSAFAASPLFFLLSLAAGAFIGFAFGYGYKVGNEHGFAYRTGFDVGFKLGARRMLHVVSEHARRQLEGK